jgi:hypothetical protein
MVSPPDDFEQAESQKTAEDRARAAAGSRRYRRAHKDEINARQREKYWTDPEFREQQKRKARRISDDVYDLLFARQGGVCAIGKHRSDRRLYADHCHTTGKLRGLLCSNCNTGLGFYHDDVDRLLAAAAYLWCRVAIPGRPTRAPSPPRSPSDCTGGWKSICARRFAWRPGAQNATGIRWVQRRRFCRALRHGPSNEVVVPPERRNRPRPSAPQMCHAHSLRHPAATDVLMIDFRGCRSEPDCRNEGCRNAQSSSQRRR